MMSVPGGELSPAIFIMGPTAAGKTDLAIELSRHLPCELISVDSALVYRDMNIGTAKPDAETLKNHPHHLVDIRDPAEPYSAADFRRDALMAMMDISQRGRIPLLVGGTMLYFKVLMEGLGTMPEADPEVRAAIEAEAAAHGWAYVHQQLAAVDPEAASRIHPNDPQRLQRALEVYRVSGINISTWHAQPGVTVFPYCVSQIAVQPSKRSLLHARIEKRFMQMLEQGLIEEVRLLYQRGDLHARLPSMRAVGYRQVWEYLEGRLNYEEMVERGVVATRQLAKRQFTWLRGWQDLHRIYTDSDGKTGPKFEIRDKSLREITAEALKILKTDSISIAIE